MADTNVNETASSGTEARQITDATIEIKIKMLDSQIYTLRVDKTMPIPVLKEKIAAQTGVPLEQQRLICRGKVLKDDHQLSDYHVEDGHTLHLVVRHPLPPASSSSTARPSGGEGTPEQQGADPTAGAGRNRTGHVSHNVVVGTFNLPDQGDGNLDVNRLISNVLTSFGIGNLTPGNLGAGNGPIMMPQGTVPEGQNQPYGASGVSPTVNQHQTAQVIPDALTTLSQYLNRMVQVFPHDGFEGQPHSTTSNTESQDHVTASGLPSVSRGLPRPAVLGSLIQSTQQLLNGPVRESFSQLAGMLEGESTVTDPTRRNQIQSAAMRNGIMMQQLGALLLELGRSTLTLQMGQSHDESIVNAGPAVYISSAGPNPIMVQPLPFQHGGNFGTFHFGAIQPPAGVTGGTPAMGEVPRNINIHIHAGSTLVPGGSPVNPGGSVTPNANADQQNSTTAPQSSGATNQVRSDTGVSRETGSVRIVPVRTVVAAVPVRPSPEPNNATFSVAYPLLARVQQLNFPQGVPVRGQVQATIGVQSSGVDTTHQQSIENIPLQSFLSQIQAEMQTSNGSVQTPNFQTQNVDGGIQIGNSSLPPSAINIPFSLQHSSENHTGATTEQNVIWGESSNDNAAANVDGRGRVQNANSDNVTVPGGAEVASLLNAVMQQIMGSHGRSGTVNQHQSDQQQRTSATKTGTVSTSATEQNISNENIDDVMKEDKNSEKLTMDMSPSLGSADSDGDLASTSGNANASTSCSNSQSEKLQPKRKDESHNGGKIGPVGLGLGGLQPLPSKRPKQNHKVKENKLSGPDSEGETATGPADDQDKQSSIARGQNVLQALVSQGISSNRRTDENGPAAQMPSCLAQMFGSMVSGGHTGSGRVDVGDVMSQLLNSPPVSNILGMSEQTGAVPQGALRNMMEQITRSPALRNTVQQMTEQIGEHSEEIENMLSGMGGEQGGFDFSRMMQRMLPLVSQVLSRGSSSISSGMDSATQTRNSNTEALAEVNNGGDRMLQIDLGPTVQKLENHDPPHEVFRSMIENAAALYAANDDAHNGLSNSSIFDQLSDTEDLANEYLAMLNRDLVTRLESDTETANHS